MRTDLRAIVELGCECGERLELPIEEVRTAFECPACSYRHALGEDQLEAIEEAFGRALMLAHENEIADSGDLAVPLLH